MAQLKDLIVSGPTRLLNDLYVQNSIQVTTGIKIGSANELKSFGTGLSINSSGVLSCTVAGTITGSGTNGYLTKWNGGSSITNGPQLGSDTTKFLNNAGGWTVPAGTTYSFSAPLSKNNSNAVSLTISTGLTMNNNALTIDSGWFDDALVDAYSVGVGLSKSQTTFSLDTMFGAEFIVGTQTAATGSWTGVTKRTALYDGMQIAYWLPYAGSGNATLNLTLAGGGTTGAVNCYYNGTSRLTTHYGAGNLVHLTYRSNVNIGGTNYTGWWSNANYDSNDYDSLREYYAQPRVDANSDFDLYMYQLLLTTKSGTVVPYSNGHNAPGTFTKTMTTDAFDPFAPIYRWSVSWDRTEAKGAIIPTGYLYSASQLVDVRYYWNIDSGGTAGTTSLTANQPIYIKAKYTRTTHTAVLVPISGSTNYLERSSIVQTLPSSNPNGTLAATETYIYIFLGYAYDKYRMVLYEQKPVYWWDSTTNTVGRFTEKLGELAYVSPSTSGTATTLFLGYNSDTGAYSLMDPASDHLVSQANSNNNVAYRVLLSYSNSNSTQINLAYKNSGLTFNPSTGILSSAKIETGSAATSYFQSQRFRGEGDAATYYHAVDFGYASHDRVDFYEYGGIFCFHKHTAAAVGSGDTVLGTITTNGWEGKLKLPNTSTPITGIGSGLAVTSSGSLYCTVTPCLIEGTKILMADGTEKNIEEVVRGDVIMSYDPNVNQTCEAVVLDCVDTGVSDDYINYFFDNGSMLTVYDKHCFYNKEIGTAKDVKKWELGDTGIDQHGQDAMFVGSEELHYAGRKHHYDLRSSNMLFFANGILNAESLTYNYWWHGDDDLPESFRKAMKADYDSSANLHKHQASRDYGMALAPIIKEIRKQEKIIADNKKLLSDSDYIVQKFTEGLIGAVEWAKAKVSRSGWRDLINTAETALDTAKSRMKTIKAKYATTETRRERFNAAVARDNACLEELKAYFKSKNELSE